VGLLAALALVEVALVRTVGPVAAQVRVLGGLGDPSADPVAGLLAVLAAAAELLARYLLLVVTMRLAALLPGAPGLLAARGARLVALPALRRALTACWAACCSPRSCSRRPWRGPSRPRHRPTAHQSWPPRCWPSQPR
jgi:hypothetical protein